MSISKQLEKLAEKKALEGNYAFASSLLEEADKRAVKTSAKGSFKSKIKELKGFTKMEGEDFCFNDKDAAKKGLAIAEQSSNFVAWKIEKCKDGWKIVSKGYDKKSSTLKSMIYKYAQPFDDFDIPESGKDLEGEYMDDPSFGGGDSNFKPLPEVSYDEDDLGDDLGGDLGGDPTTRPWWQNEAGEPMSSPEAIRADEIGYEDEYIDDDKFFGDDDEEELIGDESIDEVPDGIESDFWGDFMNNPANFEDSTHSAQLKSLTNKYAKGTIKK